MTCSACNRTIYDRHVSKTSPDNKIWHEHCLKCCECDDLLDSKYFETCGRLYCRKDYLTNYGPSCFGCAGKITDDQYFFSIKQTISAEDPMHGTQTTQSSTLFFHDKCFACNYCTRPLQKGDKYCILDSNSSTTSTPTTMPQQQQQHQQQQQKPLMICHDICALKYHSANSINNNNNTNNNNNNNTIQSNNNINSNPMHVGGQPLPPNVPAPRGKRGRMKQNRPN